MEESTASTVVENCASCGEVMDVTALAPYTNVECPNCGEEMHVKCHIGAYQILKRQGLGGMSLVFAAKDTTLGRKVAIKLLNEDYSRDSKRVEEFEKEAKITASISHPNVVRVYTVGQAYDRYYIAMELVEGDSLEQLMHREGKLGEDMITRLAIEIVEGLKAAHQAGLIHRDMKPGNVLIDSKGHAKIVDFGLALMTSGGKAIAEEIWATPYYVPPETLQLREEDLRSDIYALGASLYHALSGKPPFTTETRSTTELLKIKESVPKLEKVAKDVDPFLCEVIDKAMEFEAENRFQTYEEFLSALKQVEVFFRTGNEPEELAVPTHARRTKRKSSATVKYAIAGGAALAAVVTGVVLSTQDKEEAVVPNPKPVVESTENQSAVGDAESLRVLVAAELRIAQSLLDQAKYKEAHQRYLKLAKATGVESETVYWAGMRSAIAAWLAGDSEMARTALRQILKLQKESGGEDSAIGQKLQKAMARLLSYAPISIEQITQSQDDLDIMILFSSALKEWEQGRMQQGEELFEALVMTKASSDTTGLELYQKLGRAYLADYQAIRPFLRGFSPQSVSEAKEIKAQIIEVNNTLKTQGRARYNTKEWRRQIETAIVALDLKNQRDKERSAKESALAKDRWREAKRNAKRALVQHQFGRIHQELSKAPAITTEDKAWREQMLYLSNQVLKLYTATLQTLEGKSFAFTVKRLDGEEEYNELLGAVPTGILVSDKNGKELTVLWREVSPYTMLELHKKMVGRLQGQAEKNARREQLVAYAWLTGLEEIARHGATILSEADEGFAKRWKNCMEVINSDAAPE